MLITISLIGLATTFITGTFQIFSENGLDIHRRYNQLPLVISSMIFGFTVMVFIFIEHWSWILKFMIEVTGTRTPTAGTLLSPWVIFFIAVIYAICIYNVGRVGSALKIQQIIERRWSVKSLREEDLEEYD